MKVLLLCSGLADFGWRCPPLPVVAPGPAFTENQGQVNFFAPPLCWRFLASLSWPEVSKQHHCWSGAPPHRNSSPATLVHAVVSRQEGSGIWMEAWKDGCREGWKNRLIRPLNTNQSQAVVVPVQRFLHQGSSRMLLSHRFVVQQPHPQ